jgi:hypothetical protein
VALPFAVAGTRDKPTDNLVEEAEKASENKREVVEAVGIGNIRFQTELRNYG